MEREKYTIGQVLMTSSNVLYNNNCTIILIYSKTMPACYTSQYKNQNHNKKKLITDILSGCKYR